MKTLKHILAILLAVGALAAVACKGAPSESTASGEGNSQGGYSQGGGEIQLPEVGF